MSKQNTLIIKTVSEPIKVNRPPNKLVRKLENISSDNIIEDVLKAKSKYEIIKSPMEFLQEVKDKILSNFITSVKTMKAEEINFEFDGKLKSFQLEANNILYKMSKEK